MSPDGFYYKFDPTATSGQRLWRRASEDEPWGQGKPTFSVQYMSADELRYVANLIDDALSANIRP